MGIEWRPGGGGGGEWRDGEEEEGGRRRRVKEGIVAATLRHNKHQ